MSRSRNGGTKDEEILLIDATAAGQLQEPTHRILTDVDCDALTSIYHSWMRGESRFPKVAGNVTATTASFARLHEHDFDLTPSRYISPEASTRPDAPGLPARREELADLEAEARIADQAFAHYLERLQPWNR